MDVKHITNRKKTGKTLDSKQGKVPGFLGTCGLCSCVNVLRLAGCNISEYQMVDYAAKNDLCIKENSDSRDNGGTSGYDRECLLKAFGVESESHPADVYTLSYYVSQGHGAIISVYAGKLYNGYSDGSDSHAITVTSVKIDSNGKTIGFYVCDSNGYPDKYYTVEQIKDAFTGRAMNITKSIIR